MQALHKWTGLRLELAEYVRDHNILEDKFRFLGIYEWKNVYDRMLEHFVDEQYARECGPHWANINGGFQKNIDIIYWFQMGDAPYRSYEWIEKLPEIVLCEKVYLLLEESRQQPKYWIAECSPDIVHLIINDTYGVEDYYITDRKFNWLITENHHDVVKFLGRGLNPETIEELVKLPN